MICLDYYISILYMTDPFVTTALITLIVLSTTKLIIKFLNRVKKSSCSPFKVDMECNDNSDDGIDLP